MPNKEEVKQFFEDADQAMEVAHLEMEAKEVIGRFPPEVGEAVRELQEIDTLVGRSIPHDTSGMETTSQYFDQLTMKLGSGAMQDFEPEQYLNGKLWYALGAEDQVEPPSEDDVADRDYYAAFVNRIAEKHKVSTTEMKQYKKELSKAFQERFERKKSVSGKQNPEDK